MALGSSSLFSVLGEFKGLDCEAIVVRRDRSMAAMKKFRQDCTVYFRSQQHCSMQY